jgi:hypothetical protein
MLASLIFKVPSIKIKQFSQWEVAKDAHQGTSGCHEVKLEALQHSYLYHTNYKEDVLHFITS